MTRRRPGRFIRDTLVIEEYVEFEGCIMKLVALISGGIDSPVAAHLLLEKGADVVAVHFDNRPFTDEKHAEKAKMLVEKLREISGRDIKLYIVPHGKNQL
ncbi:MAG: 7-cyano-7-deazaguanine synthase, partial [Thermoplasmata archaeon]|nr:7-cyano-7-deazaguanine synthase [Thermoplasmata archaeon]